MAQKNLSDMFGSLMEQAGEKNNDKRKRVEVHVADIKRHNGPIMLPDGMGNLEAIDVLKRREEYDREEVVVREVLPIFAWDGALALQQAIEEAYGVAMQASTPSWFGPIPPAMISVEVGVGRSRKVPWGRFSLPGVTGFVETFHPMDEDGRVIFGFGFLAKVTHANEDAMKALVDRVREIAASSSIYRGQALEIDFKSPSAPPQVKFLRLSGDPVIFSEHLARAVEVNILTPIRHSETVRKAGIPLKRGVLLAGPYGTGKTLCANQVAKECVEHGWTFLYVKNVEELPRAFEFAMAFEPAVVFAEDIDRAAGRERDEDVNTILNTLDGIGAKAGSVITVLTSNHADQVNAAMRRPGRIDVVLNVCPPDAKACEALMRHYGGVLIADEENLFEAGVILDGQIPAVIREAVERAKLGAINRTGGEAIQITGKDLSDAAEVLIEEQKLFRPKPADEGHPWDAVTDRLIERMAPEVKAKLREVYDGE